MGGAVDLFSGSSALSGTNLFTVDKNPLQQLNQGVEDVIGQHGQNTGNSIFQALNNIIDLILGIDPNSAAGQNPDWSTVNTMFTNLFTFLGGIDPASPTFDPIGAIINFITEMLNPTNLLAALVPNANHSGGVTGFIPMENLALDLIGAVIGGAQSLIDAILGAFGVPAGSGTETMVNQMFTNLSGMLATPDLLSTLFNPIGAITDVITGLINPTNLLAPMNPLTSLLNPLNIPGLDASKITSGQFPQNMVENLVADLENVAGQLLAPLEGWLLPIIPASAVANTSPNLLANPTYDSTKAVNDPGGNWIYDPAVSHTADGTGSVKVIANGTPKQLLSDPPIPVAANQQLSIKHWLEWSGVVAGPGDAFVMSINTYLGSAGVNTTKIASVATPGVSSGWTQLTGS